MLEPAAWGKPVFFGAYTDHCLEVARLLLAAGAGKQVRDGAELTAEMADVLRDRVRLHAMGDGGILSVRTYAKQLTGVGANVPAEFREALEGYYKALEHEGTGK